jgi:hypothetical protein
MKVTFIVIFLSIDLGEFSHLLTKHCHMIIAVAQTFSCCVNMGILSTDRLFTL